MLPRPYFRRIISVSNETDSHFPFDGIGPPSPKPLSLVPLNQWFRIERLIGPSLYCDRLLDLGFTPGEKITVTQTAPLGDPLVVRIRGTLLALRKREAAWVLVV